MWRSSAPWTIAAANGCSLPRSTLAAKRNSSSSLHPSTGATVTNFGLPSVRVPVLSTTSVLTLRRTSIASAFLKRTPSVAPLPVATMIDMGVASPSAQGQATMSTAIALIRAYAIAGSGPQTPQTMKVTTAISTTAGTK